MKFKTRSTYCDKYYEPRDIFGPGATIDNIRSVLKIIPTLKPKFKIIHSKFGLLSFVGLGLTSHGFLVGSCACLDVKNGKLIFRDEAEIIYDHTKWEDQGK